AVSSDGETSRQTLRRESDAAASRGSKPAREGIARAAVRRDRRPPSEGFQGKAALIEQRDSRAEYDLAEGLNAQIDALDRSRGGYRPSTGFSRCTAARGEPQ